MDPDRTAELIAELNDSGERWEDSFVDAWRIRCSGCGTEYDSPVGLSIVAMALSGDTRRTYLDGAQCAEDLHLYAVARIMRESDENGLGPLTVDADGRTLAAWRIAEIREGRTWAPGEEPWRDAEAAPVVPFFAVDPVRDASATLDAATRSDVGVASDDELADFLAEDEDASTA